MVRVEAAVFHRLEPGQQRVRHIFEAHQYAVFAVPGIDAADLQRIQTHEVETLAGRLQSAHARAIELQKHAL